SSVRKRTGELRFLLMARQNESIPRTAGNECSREPPSPRSRGATAGQGKSEKAKTMKEKRTIKLMKTRLKIFTTILYVLACCAFLPQMQAQLPPEIPGNPDGGYPGSNTADG